MKSDMGPEARPERRFRWAASLPSQEVHDSAAAVAIVAGPLFTVTFSTPLLREVAKISPGTSLAETGPSEILDLLHKARETGAVAMSRGMEMPTQYDSTVGPRHWDLDVIPMDGMAGEDAYLIEAREVTRRLELETEVAEKAALLDLIFEYTPWGITVADTELKLVRTSDYGSRMFSADPSDLNDRTLGEVVLRHPVYNQAGRRGTASDLPLHRAIRQSEVVLNEEWYVPDATRRSRRTLLCNAAPIQGADRSVIGGIVTFGDISEIQRMMARLRALLGQKEVLLRELHHRVKNNLQMVASMAALEKMRHPAAAEALDSLISRVEAIGGIHQNLSINDDVANVAFGKFLRKLCSDLLLAFNMGDRITSEVQGDEDLPLDVATPIGLIFNELITNILKHGFAGRDRGSISVTMSSEAGNWVFVLADDGIGRPVAKPYSSTMGLQLVDDLVRQVNGKLQVSGRPGRGAKWRLQVSMDPLVREA